MPDEGDGSRLVIECLECDAAYAAVETADGDAVPIGSKGGCSCGSTEFTRVSSEELLSGTDADEVAGED